MEKWEVIAHYRNILAEEGVKPKNGKVKVALIYPNRYDIAIQNLGFQFVWNELNKIKGLCCERFVLDYYEDNLSIENQRFLNEFDIIAISINYEDDVLNLIKFLHSQKIPIFKDERDYRYAPIISGGVLGVINPNILKDIVDVQLLGDFRPMLEDITKIFAKFENKDDFLSELKDLIYVLPNNLGQLTKPIIDSSGKPIYSTIKTVKGEFENTFLIEASKSCKYNCRFCTTGYNLRPYRKIDINKVIDIIERHRFSDHIGIISAAFGDISNLDCLLQWMIDKKLTISISSLRIDSLNFKLLENLKSLGVRSITIAEEVASGRLKKLIAKDIYKNDILNAVELIASVGIENLKLYYMFGFYEETIEDVKEIVERVGEISNLFRDVQRKRFNRLGKIKVSVNIFNPKPFTPLQFFPLESKDKYNKKLKYLKNLNKIPNVKVNIMSYNDAVLQTTIAKAGKDIGQFYNLLIKNRFDVKNSIKEYNNEYIYKMYSTTDELPWENMIEPNIKKEILIKEFEKCLAAIRG